jgi:hypothetical protein
MNGKLNKTLHCTHYMKIPYFVKHGYSSKITLNFRFAVQFQKIKFTVIIIAFMFHLPLSKYRKISLILISEAVHIHKTHKL